MIAPAQLLAVVALLPAAINPSLLVGAETITLTLCGGGRVSLPLDNPLPGSNGAACCAKGCHSSETRKKAKDRLAA